MGVPLLYRNLITSDLFSATCDSCLPFVLLRANASAQTAARRRNVAMESVGVDIPAEMPADRSDVALAPSSCQVY